MNLYFFSLIAIFIRSSIQQVLILDETFNSLTYDQNLDNTTSYWVSQPPFSAGTISYHCQKNTGWEPQMLIMGPNQILTKVTDSLSLTSGKYFYQFKVSLNLLLIDMNRSSFTFSITFNGSKVTFPQKDQPSYTSDSLDFYCNEALTYLIPCLDYCFKDKYDSQISISTVFQGYQDNISIDFSSDAKNDEKVGIINLKIEAYLCDSNCQQCIDMPTKCTKCQNSSQAIDFYEQICVNSCSEGQFQTTDPLYPLQQVCKNCLVQDCIQCISSDTCVKCSNGKYFDGVQCSKCDSICSTCSTSASQCLTCSNGYYMSSTYLCTPCPDGCSSCSSDKYCNSCQDGFYQEKIGDLTATCKPCLSECRKCADNMSCTQCYWPRVLFNDDPTKDYFYECVTDCGSSQFISNDSRSCVKFTDSNCLNPSSSDGCLRGDCQLPDYSNFSRECVNVCGDGFFRGFKDIRKTFTQIYKCPEGSQLCTSLQYSTQCEKGYYLNKVSNTEQYCNKCGLNCEQCQNEIICQKCNLSFSLDSSICVSECSGSQYSQDQVCQVCPLANCQKCNNDKVCAKCNPGYDLVNGLCEVSCTNGQFRSLKTLKCTSCSTGCKVCTSLINCSECYPRYFGSQTCSKCHSNCLHCSGSQFDQCTSCDPQSNMFFYQNQCIENCPNGYFNDTNSMSCLSCNDSNCQVCKSGVNTCQKCNDPDLFLLDNSSCSLTCPEDHQIFTKNNVKQCLKLSCLSGFQQVQDQCLEICGDGLNFGEYQCDDGNNFNDDGCSSSCQIEKLFVCQNEPKNGKSICHVPLTYKLSSQTKNQIILQFVTDITITDDFKNYLQITIEGLKSSAYTYSLSNQNNDNIVLIDFQFSIQVQSQLVVRIQNQKIKNVKELILTKLPKGSYILNALTLTLQLNTEYVAEQSQKQAAESIQKATQAVSTVIIASLVPIVKQTQLMIIFEFKFYSNQNQTLGGGITMVASIIDIAQIIKLHKYLNIEFPLNLELFFTVFEDFSFPFVTNFFEYAIPEDYEKSTLENLENKGLQSLYIKNAGQHYTTFVFALVIHLLLKIIGKKFQRFDRLINKLFVYAIYHEVVMSVYLEIVFNIFLQFTNMEIEKPIDHLNLAIVFITFIFVFPIPFIAAYLMKKYFHRLKEKEIEAKYGCLYEGLKDDYFSMIFFIILHIRKILISLLILYFSQITYVQCTFLSFMPLLLLAFVFKKLPFEHQRENIKIIIQEVFFFIASILFIGLKSMDESIEEKRTQISWAIIAAFTAILLLHFYFSMREVYLLIIKKPSQFILTTIMKFCKKIRNRKVSPQSTISGRSKNDNQDFNYEQQNLKKSIISCNNIYSKNSSIEQQINAHHQKIVSKENYGKSDILSIQNFCIDQAKLKTTNQVSNNIISCQEISQVNSLKDIPPPPMIVEEPKSKIENNEQIQISRRIPRAFTSKIVYLNLENGISTPNTNKFSAKNTDFNSIIQAQLNSCDVSSNNQILNQNNCTFYESPPISSARLNLKSRYSNIENINSNRNSEYQRLTIQNEDDFNNINQMQSLTNNEQTLLKDIKKDSSFKSQNSDSNNSNPQKIDPESPQEEQNINLNQDMQDLELKNLNANDDKQIQINNGQVVQSLPEAENNQNILNSNDNRNLDHKDQVENLTIFERLNQKVIQGQENITIKLDEKQEDTSDFDQNFQIIQSSKSKFFRTSNQPKTRLVTSVFSTYHQLTKQEDMQSEELQS